MSYTYYYKDLEFEFGDGLTDYGHNKMTTFIDLYKDIFTDGFSTYDECFEIKVRNSTPIYSRSYPNSKKKNKLKKKINELLSIGHIEKSNSQWSSPVHTKFIDDNLELIVNYNALNKVICDYDQDMPTINEVVNSINPSAYFSKIVLRDGFRQLQLSPNSKHLTAFDTDFGTFQWVTVPNGLKNNQKYLQDAVEEALDDTDEDYVAFYLGHILIFTNDFDEHLEQLKDVFYNLQQSNFKVDNDQSEFFFENIDYLGYQINQNGISISSEKYNKILAFEQPENKSELRSFLGLISFYKQFVNRYAYEIYTTKLYDVLSRDDFYLNRNEENAFIQLKGLFGNGQSVWFGYLDE